MTRPSFNTRLQIMWCCIVGVAMIAGFLLGASFYADESPIAAPTAVFMCLATCVLAATLWVHESEIRGSVETPKEEAP